MKNSKDQILEEKLEEFGLNLDSTLFRYTSKSHLTESNGEYYLKAKEESSDAVIDHYEDIGHTFISKEFGLGLSFLTKPETEMDRKDRKLVSIKIANVINQGGYIYRITSLPAYLEGYFVTLPTGKIKIINI